MTASRLRGATVCHVARGHTLDYRGAMLTPMRLRTARGRGPRAAVALVALVAAGSSLAGCSEGATEADAGRRSELLVPEECDAVAPTSCMTPSPRWADVQPIFATRCAVCHGNIPGHWPLDTYGHVVDWNVEIRGMLLSCTMPPIDSDVVMTLEERQLILEWLRCNSPR